MKAIAKIYNIEAKILVCNKNDNPIAYLPFYEKKFFYKKAYNPTLVYYSPLVFNIPSRKHPNRELLLEYDICRIIGSYLHKTYHQVFLNMNPELYDIRGFKDSGLSAIPQYTFIVDLKQEIMFFESEKKKLRATANEQYEFNNVFNPERMLELLNAMYQRKKHPFPPEKALLQEQITELNKHGIVNQYNVTKGDRIVSSILILRDNSKIAYGWLTASEQSEMQKGASLYLFDNLFKECAKKYDYFDMCGANSQGPSRLKAALGADLKMFMQIRK